ncbi:MULTISPECIES: DUF1707 SHOCT-like domain-containing protein [Lentzea]|uniref:DUF1707 domain-containing protein n=1 Tax=Lentzea jiangxiensis TaxID=641025 RepID=A0A1H0EQW9_9PSEU|nr:MULTISPECIES: DUF1707 domain-containing protein [Lentzea]MCG8920952.1 DUF1707 domain-containing protein [Lentzea sp. CC55]WVH79676.1 DUF1707 domain-containing protein [Lentzea sp. DG1S-22]SDN84762.1 protein of unknown function [Lentzea jiangxiensis]
MSDPSRDIRVGDTERQQALQVLGEHMSAGRIDVEEYGERSARITTAKTRGELMALFHDLPDPRPQFVAPVPMFAEPAKAPARRWEGAVVPVVGVAVAIAFFVLVRNPLIFLLIPAFAILWGAWNGRRR